MHRRKVLLLCASVLSAFALPTLAQSGTKVPVVGVLALGVESRLTQFREGLAKLGYVDGRNIRLEERRTGDRYARLDDVADEFVRIKVDVIVAMGRTATLAASKATTSIPIVMVAGIDPVEAKLAQSMARPGGNLTGVATVTQELGPKRLQLIKEAIPGLARLGIVWNPDSGRSSDSIAAVRKAAMALKLNLQIVETRSAGEFDKAFESLARSGIRAFALVTGSMFEANLQTLLDASARHRMAGIFAYGNWSDAGGLLTYGPDPLEPYRHSATYVDKILKGARPGDIPIEEPTKYELVVNLKTAKALKIRIPQSILARADRVID